MHIHKFPFAHMHIHKPSELFLCLLEWASYNGYGQTGGEQAETVVTLRIHAPSSSPASGQEVETSCSTAVCYFQTLLNQPLQLLIIGTNLKCQTNTITHAQSHRHHVN